jgi:hypothetical protein
MGPLMVRQDAGAPGAPGRPPIGDRPTTAPSAGTRRHALQAAVDARVAEGWRVTMQTDDAAHLVKPDRLNKVLFLLVAFGVLRGVLQPLALMLRGEQQLDLTVDQDGRVREVRRWPSVPDDERAEDLPASPARRGRGAGPPRPHLGHRRAALPGGVPAGSAALGATDAEVARALPGDETRRVYPTLTPVHRVGNVGDAASRSR